MRFSLLLLLAVPVCFAQTAVVPEQVCASAKIVTPQGEYPMPVVVPAGQFAMRISKAPPRVVATVPPCPGARAQPVIVKRLRVLPAPHKIELVPNPFTPLAKP